MDTELIRAIAQALWFLAERVAWATAGAAVALVAEFEWEACSWLRRRLQRSGRGVSATVRR